MRHNRYNFNRGYNSYFNEEFDDDFDEDDEYEDCDDEFDEDGEDVYEDYYSRNNSLHEIKFPSFTNEFFMKCPLCHNSVSNSEYLANNFKEQPYSYWSACLVTHYRHTHINYYDASWKNPYYANKNPEYKYSSHDDYRTLVNNRAKRQLIRGIVKNTDFDIETKKSLIEGFKSLQFNDEKTNSIIEKKLQLISGNKPKGKGRKKINIQSMNTK